MDKRKIGVVFAIIIPIIGGLIYEKIKHIQLSEENKKLTQENGRLKTRNDVLEEQNESLFKELEKIANDNTN